LQTRETAGSLPDTSSVRELAELHAVRLRRVLAESLDKLPSVTTGPLMGLVAHAAEVLPTAGGSQTAVGLSELRRVADDLQRLSYEVAEALYRYDAAQRAAQAAGMSQGTVPSGAGFKPAAPTVPSAGYSPGFPDARRESPDSPAEPPAAERADDD
jgi:hypothetical protein